VAGGIIPESAIVTGLPDGVVEKNQDALLLSPASLLERSLGRRVHLRRTSLATGKVREHEAVIRSGAGGAVVLQTEAVFEALQCSGLNETIVYPSVPRDLSAKPTLSVRTRSPAAATANVTLSYLASGFDWQANYVATMRPDGRSVDLFAWGHARQRRRNQLRQRRHASRRRPVERVQEDRPRRERGGGELNLRCWSGATTATCRFGSASGATRSSRLRRRPASSGGGDGRDWGREYRRDGFTHRAAGNARRPQAVPAAGARHGRSDEPEAGRIPGP
jgi:hypothetical protein